MAPNPDVDPMDPPKRPLTAAFLFAQHIRPIVRQDLEATLGRHQKLELNAVNQEVHKRWRELPDEEREIWKDRYRDAVEKWKRDQAEYLKARDDAMEKWKKGQAEDLKSRDDPIEKGKKDQTDDLSSRLEELNIASSGAS